MKLKNFHNVINNTPEEVRKEVRGYMDDLDLKAKMDKYFAECKPEDLIARFEKLGYEFTKIET